jgi:hypothetical protein
MSEERLLRSILRMGHMRTFLGGRLGFEWWGAMRPAEMTTAAGVRYIPILLGLWRRA